MKSNSHLIISNSLNKNGLSWNYGSIIDAQDYSLKAIEIVTDVPVLEWTSLNYRQMGTFEYFVTLFMETDFEEYNQIFFQMKKLKFEQNKI